MKGHLTVEASYIFPFCFMVIGIVCYLGIFLYNQSVLKMTGYECILQTLGEFDTEDEVEEHLLKRVKEAAEARTLAMKDLEIRVKTTISKISVSYQGGQSGLNVPFEVTVVYEKTFPERILRMTQGKTGE